MKLLIDMNLSPRWAACLTEAGFNAAHWSMLGRAGAPDVEILAYARDQSFILVTNDLDFSAILAATQGRTPSVVQVRGDDLSPEKLGALVVAALRRCASELDAGAVLSIDVHRARLRMLPIA